MNKEIKVAPSILASDFAHLYDEVKKIENSGADAIHLDIMDGIFVKEINFPLSKIKEISHKLHHKLDVHLMVQDYDYYINNLQS